ncbi:MFS transporter [Nocardia sp. NPDC020380]|uniref:MFS transporter n=1 Tax=Nocardia sp. NPDC020380 TaxID=3364309 RepID=UPI0037967F51
MTRSGTAKSGAPLSAWLTLAAVAVGTLVVLIDGMAVMVAMPAIAEDLHASPAGIQWVGNAQLLALAGLTIPAGTLADRMGRKKAFLLGVGGFALCSLLCGLAPSIGLLLAARVVQGAFGALLMPAGLAAIRAAFPERRLPAAVGVLGSVAAVAAACGPLLGGVLVQHGSWRWTFFVNVPFGIVGVAVGVWVMTESAVRVYKRMDLAGAASSTIAIVAGVWAITDAQDHGWNSPRTIGLGMVGVLAFATFIVVERHVRNPMVPLGLFRNRSFTAGLALLTLTVSVLSAVIFYLMFFLQGAQGRNETAAAVALLPLTVVYAVSPLIGGVLVQKIGARTTLVIGAVCNAVAMTLMLRLTVDSGFAISAPPLALIGVGVGFLLVGSVDAVLAGTPVDKAGVTAGVKESVQQLGGTLGVAISGTVLMTLVGARFPAAARNALAGTPAAGLADDHAVQQQVALGFPEASQQALGRSLEQSGTPPDQAHHLVDTLTDVAHRTFTDSLHVVYGAGICVAVLAALLALLVRNNTSRAADAARSSRAVVAGGGEVSVSGPVPPPCGSGAAGAGADLSGPRSGHPGR